MKVVEKVLQKKIHKVGWGCVRFRRFLKFHKRSIRFSEVLRGSKKSPSLEQFFSKGKKNAKVLQGFTGFRGSIRVHLVGQRSKRFHKVRNGSVRFFTVLCGCTVFDEALQGYYGPS